MTNDQNCSNNDKNTKPNGQNCFDKDSNTKSKDDKITKSQDGKIANAKAAVGDNAKKLLSKASVIIEKSSGIKQLVIGTAAGWCTGFLTTKVGRTAAFTVGGTVILVAAAGQTGLININWDKVSRNVTKASEKVEESVTKNAPKIATMKKYARTNTYFAAGFLGGFLLGVCS